MTADEQRVGAIWAKQEAEMFYWLREYFDGFGSDSVTIRQIDRGGGGHSTVIFDNIDGCAVIINTDTTAPDAESSHEYMMLESPVLKTLGELINRTQPGNANREQQRR